MFDRNPRYSTLTLYSVDFTPDSQTFVTRGKDHTKHWQLFPSMTLEELFVDGQVADVEAEVQAPEQEDDDNA